MTMSITIKCFASLSRFSPPDAEAHAIAPGETVASLVARLGIPPDDLKLVFVNGDHVELSAVLKDDVYVTTPNYIYQFDLTAWGWLHLIVGVVAVAVGIVLFLYARRKK